MARIRSIKPEFPHSESMGRVSRDARLLFVQLWTICDDSGRTRAASRMLASLLYPYDDDAPGLIDTWLAELEAEQCIVRYRVDGSTYLQVCNWLNHQRIDKPSASKVPPFVEDSRILANPREGSRPLLGEEGNGKEGKGEDPEVSAAPTEVAVLEPVEATVAPPEPVIPKPDPIDTVFAHWRSVMDHPRSTLDAKRRRAIKAALALYPADVLCESISGYRNSPHHMGQNDRATIYDDLELLLRDAAHIDAGLRFARDPPRIGLSALTRRNVAAIEDWTPPEMRNGTA